jgi:hypothetical protein
LGEVANRPAAERLTDAQVERIRRRRESGELLGALADEYGQSTRTLRRRLDAAAARAAAREQKAARRAEHERSRRLPENAIPIAHGDRPELLRRPPAPGARLQTELDEASQRESVSAQAAAPAAAEYVEQLEAAYQHAFTAIETLVTAIERVQELRGHQRAWETGNKLGVAAKRPEPWHVRAAHDDELRQLSKRFTRAVNSRW